MDVSGLLQELEQLDLLLSDAQAAIDSASDSGNTVAWEKANDYYEEIERQMDIVETLLYDARIEMKRMKR